MHLLIVGNWGRANIGGCFDRNAVELGHQVPPAETRLAMEAPTWLRRLITGSVKYFTLKHSGHVFPENIV
jgi:hypothetical protein